MGLSKEQKIKIQEVLKNALRKKFKNYNPETSSMPFHTRLLGKDRMALFSFIQSLNTNFGTSIFEPVAVALAKENFKEAISQASPGNKISKSAQLIIQNVIDKLSTADGEPDKIIETEEIRKVAQEGNIQTVKLTKIDLLLESKKGEFFLFDLKTAKPNAGGFKEFKRTLLEWVAAALYQNPKAKINSLIAIPYNPYDPKPYSRWTMRGMLDLKNELIVGKDFWNFLGNGDVYQDILNCFEKVGIELRSEIDEHFKKFNK